MNLKAQRSAGKCMCVCAASFLFTPADISRPSGTFNQPGVKQAEGQMRRKLHSSEAEITLCCLFAWFFCTATQRHPSEPQLVFCNLLFLFFYVFDVERLLCGSSTHEEQKPMLTTQSLNAYSSCHCRVIR